MSSSVAIPVRDGKWEGDAGKTTEKESEKDDLQAAVVCFPIRMKVDHDVRRVVHGAKVGIALALVSLLYSVYPLYQGFKQNGVWAVMTVVVMYEFYAGATLSKGLNRIMGTALGGGLGLLAGLFADFIGGVGKGFAVGIAIFFFGAVATYIRSVPRIKKRYDYGFMIFILSFSLVVVSGVQTKTDYILKTAIDRLGTVAVGLGVCFFTSLCIFPIWAGDELHLSTAYKFEHLALSIEGLLDTYFQVAVDKENKADGSFKLCRTIMHSKAKDETLANFARWEPWHGRFGLRYPWAKYIQIGDLLRELAATIVSLEVCIQSPRQPAADVRQAIKGSCESVASSLTGTLRDLGESLMNMRKCEAEAFILPKLKRTRAGLSNFMSPSDLFPSDPMHAHNLAEDLAGSTFMFLLSEMVEKLEVLAKEVDELGELAEFKTDDV
ncbi:hypothetical protein BT93_H0940 [Corymbia citriodora subsp. variegata]|nr:hypothetical protein BT93_H0940 [Corymbia citriodora subsp. variegata]